MQNVRKSKSNLRRPFRPFFSKNIPKNLEELHLESGIFPTLVKMIARITLS